MKILGFWVTKSRNIFLEIPKISLYFSASDPKKRLFPHVVDLKNLICLFARLSTHFSLLVSFFFLLYQIPSKLFSPHLLHLNIFIYVRYLFFLDRESSPELAQFLLCWLTKRLFLDELWLSENPGQCISTYTITSKNFLEVNNDKNNSGNL